MTTNSEQPETISPAKGPVRAKRVKEEQQARKRSKQARKRAGGGFVTWQPTEADIQLLESLSTNAELLQDYLVNAIERGVAISIKFSDQSESVGAVARDAYAAWNKGTALSAWNDDAWKALVKLLYALHHVYPDYPAVDPQPEVLESDEW